MCVNWVGFFFCGVCKWLLVLYGKNIFLEFVVYEV